MTIKLIEMMEKKLVVIIIGALYFKQHTSCMYFHLRTIFKHFLELITLNIYL